MEIPVHFPGVAFVLTKGWSVLPTWTEESIRLHGLYLVHESSELLQLHLRFSPSGVGRLLDEGGLRAMLAEQSWGGPPQAISVHRPGPIVAVGGSWTCPSPAPSQHPLYQWIREWFITDGPRLANAILPHSRQTNPTVVDSCESMIASLRFTEQSDTEE